MTTKAKRSIGGVLLKLTLAITLVLGVAAAVTTMWFDLQREKDAVENLAKDFMASAAPSAASAVYNFDQAAAVQVAEGLFLERAIIGIQIINEGDTMVDEYRQASPTLPRFVGIGSADLITLERLLYEPGFESNGTPIGQFSITIDKSLVAPEIVGRLLTYFVVTTAKNVLYGLCLFWMVFAALTSHISNVARVTQSWQPGDPGIEAPKPPRFLRGTELEGLGERIEELTRIASGQLALVKRSHEEALDSNELLSETVLDRTRALEKANVQLRRMADHDGLTGLYNRASFDRLFSEAFHSAATDKSQLAILLIDIDHFKAFNDFYGHQAGDDVLKKFAQILQQLGAEHDCFMSRYGGEEFACILDSDAVSPDAMAEHIHTALRKADIEHQHSPTKRRITVSIGTASLADMCQYDNPDIMVSAADDALYEAKRSGRNSTSASTIKIREQAQEQRKSVAALLDGIERNEFEPFLQPQVDARTGQLFGVEALVRWVQKDGTIKAPADFIPLAEQTGLMSQIDGIMVDKLKVVLEKYPGVIPRLSFNVTGESIAKEGYIEKIIDLTKLPDARITVELLETAFIDHPDDMFLWQLDALREAGVNIEIDDFGTGRTSILGLMAISPSRLKIARELIVPLGEHAGQTKLVKSVIEIASSLGTDVLAEGIENQETAQLLIDIGCPIQQGFHHGKPMPVIDLIDRYSDPGAFSKREKRAN